MTIKMIMCTDAFGALGYKGDLIYKISEDLKRFKKLTEGSIVIMGRKTLESIPNQYLPDRINVVLTTDKNYKPKNSGVIVMHDVDTVLNHYSNGEQDKDVFIIGGETLYNQFFDHVQVVHLTRVLQTSDVFDTEFEIEEFENEDIFVKYNLETKHDNKLGLHYQFIDYVRWSHFTAYHNLENQKKSLSN